jgi:hypothetical protein
MAGTGAAHLTGAGQFPQLSQGPVLVSVAIAIAVLDQVAPVLRAAPSSSTVRRTLNLATARTLTRIAQTRTRIRVTCGITSTTRAMPCVAD